MDAINLLPVKTLDVTTSRPRSDASADQHAPGFSFANLLDEKNVPPSQPAVTQKPPMEIPGGEGEIVEPLAEAAPTSDTAELSTLLAMFSTMPSLPTPPVAATPVGTVSLENETNLEGADNQPNASAATAREATGTIAPRADQSRVEPDLRETRPVIEGERRGTRAVSPAQITPPTVPHAVKQPPGDPAAPVARLSAPTDEEVPPAPVAAPAVLPILAPTPEAFAGAAPAPMAPPIPIVPERDRPMAPAPLRTAPVPPLPSGLNVSPVDSEASLGALASAGLPVTFNPTAARKFGEPQVAPISQDEGVAPAVARSSAPVLPPATVVLASPLPTSTAALAFATAPVLAPDAATTAPAAAQPLREVSPLPIVKAGPQPTVQADFRATTTVVTPLLDGTFTAMQEVAMPDPVKPPAPEPKAVTLAANSATLQSTISLTDGRADIPVAALHRSPGSGSRQGDEQPAFQQQPSPSVVPVPIPGSTFAPASPEISAAAPVLRAEAETVIHRTMDAAERLRATGGERLEVQIRLDSGHELTVRLHLTQGEVKPVFVTESQELRRAIEQNWAQFSDRSSDKGTRVTTPVFESPNSQSGMNDLNQRQREGRERAFAQAQEESFAGANLPGRHPFRGPNAKPTTVGAPAGIQLYA